MDVAQDPDVLDMADAFSSGTQASIAGPCHNTCTSILSREELMRATRDGSLEAITNHTKAGGSLEAPDKVLTAKVHRQRMAVLLDILNGQDHVVPMDICSPRQRVPRNGVPKLYLTGLRKRVTRNTASVSGDHNPQTNDDTSSMSPLSMFGSSVLFDRHLVREIFQFGLPLPNSATPLHNSVRLGNLTTVGHLLSLKANPNSKDERGATPIIHACGVRSSDTAASLVQVLLAAKANINARDEFGWTALSVACYARHSKAAHSLIRHGADVNLTAQDGETPLILASKFGEVQLTEHLLSAKAHPNAPATANGWTPLMCAAESGHLDTTRLLLAAHADVNMRDVEGWSSVMFAAYYHHTRVVRELVFARADLSVCSLNGYTTLVWACRQGHDDTVDLLLRYYEPPVQEMAEAVCMAFQCGHEDLVRFLVASTLQRSEQYQAAIDVAVTDMRKILSKMEWCLAAGRCTYSVTGDNFVFQEWYICRTCCPDDENVGVCASCAEHCHQGHVLVRHVPTPFYCDCGLGTYGSKCQRNIPQASCCGD